MAFQYLRACCIALAFLVAELLRTTEAYNGGVAIRYPNTTCPDGTFYIGTSLVANCCTDGTYGAPGGSSYCCPSESDCKTTVENLIQCANSTWTYFPSPDNAAIGFCCLPDWVGYVQSDSSGNHEGVACGTPGYVLSDDQTTVPSIKLAAQATVTVSASATSSPVSASATLTTSTTTTAATTSSSSAASSTTAASSGLSTGAQAGIGVGVSVGVLGLAAAIGAWFLLKRKRANRVTPQTEVKPKPDPALAVVDTPKYGSPPHPVESGGQTYSEMSATPLSELPSETRTHELPADWQNSKPPGTYGFDHGR